MMSDMQEPETSSPTRSDLPGKIEATPLPGKSPKGKGKGKDKRKSRSTKRSSKNAERAHLTEVEKRTNHISSEQKRRQNIRTGYDRLSEVVPNLRGLARSEAYVLQQTVRYGRELVTRRLELLRMSKERGLEVDSAYEYEVVPDLFLEVSPVPSPEHSSMGSPRETSPGSDHDACSESMSFKGSLKSLLDPSAQDFLEESIDDFVDYPGGYPEHLPHFDDPYPGSFH